MDTKMTDLKSSITSKFPAFSQFADTWGAVTTRIQYGSQWEGVKAKFPHIKEEIYVIDPVFVNQAAPKLRFWIGGLIYTVTLLWFYRRLAYFIKD